MKELLALALVLACPYPLCNGQTVRPGCNLNNCSRSNAEICAANGQQCRRFSNECALESVNCNATLSAVWNRTDGMQCLNLRANATGSCSCPTLRTCSNQTIAAGICTHRDGHACRLFRTECDLARARCNREIWRPIDIMQCRGSTFNQTRTCTCPKSLLCSRNAAQLCTQVNRNTCRLYNNECDLEGDRCRGQRLLDVNNIHCRGFTPGANRTCSCPLLMACQPNVTNICVRNANNRCQLIRNMCDLEAQRCRGNVLTPTLAVQCRDIRAGETGDCACPGLASCSVNRTNICVRTRVGCRLKTNECELERARCFGEVAVPASPLQCRGFLPGDGRACACPGLETCNTGNRTICVRSEQGCTLLRNDCELTEARCAGQNLTPVDHIQCRNFAFNQLRNCSCPNIGICRANSTNVCVTTSTNQCRLLRNVCAVEEARCHGEALTLTSALQCRQLMLNTSGNCFCPRLRNCSTTSANICVRETNNNNTCLLLQNECALEQALCEGRSLRRVDGIHCRNFTRNLNGTCYCSNLEACNRSSSAICVIQSTQCRLVRNACELEQAKCEGTNLIKTHATQCLNFEVNQQSNCSCPNLLTCSQNLRRICVSTRAGCKLLTTQCEYEEARCTGKAVRTEDSIHCQGLQDYEERSCFCPNLRTCSRHSTSLCVGNANGICTLVGNECDYERAKCQGQSRGVRIVPDLHCLNFTLSRPATCRCSNLFNCSSNAANICIKTTSGCKLLRNECDVENEKCQGSVQIISPLNCLGFTFGQMGSCSCPNLKTCSPNKTNICVKTSTGCSFLKNECELERLRCEGHKLKILPHIQCNLLEPGGEGSCTCPNWLLCQQNTGRVCAETATGCRLLRDECDLEERKCRGETLNVTSFLQCQGFRAGQLRNCACPELKTCSRDGSTKVCVRNRGNCKLMANSCENELAKCEGEQWCKADIEECRNLAVGQQSKCSCPKLQTCSHNRAVNICVELKGACKLMRNQCALEKAKCKGQAWTPTNAIQCQNYKTNGWRWCACPRLFNCCNKKATFCVRGPDGCKLMKTDCELQLARCRGEVWTRTDALQCLGFKPGEGSKKCTCPLLETCRQSSRYTRKPREVCVRNVKGCKLLRDNCELERSLCSGEVWRPVDGVQCLNFPLHYTRSCHCPNLDSCSNTTSVCAKGLQNQCYSFKSECDMRGAQCEGQKLTLTLPARCQGIGFNDHDECKCPESRNCNLRQPVCAHRSGQCKLFKNYCDLRKSHCREENWKRTNSSRCCQFRINESKTCIHNLHSAVCARGETATCQLFPTRCDFIEAKSNETKAWSEVNRNNCKCLVSGRTGRCAERIVCSPTNDPSSQICGRQGATYRYFASVCHLRRHNYRTCSDFREVPTRRCRRS